MDVTSDLLAHGECRRIQCRICEAPWSERYVGTVLVRNRAAVGGLCPRCLKGTPADAAVWIGEYCLRLRQVLDDVDECLSLSADQNPFPADFKEYHDHLRKITEMTARRRRFSTLFQLGQAELPLQFDRMRNNLIATWEESKRLIAEARSLRGHPPRVYSPRITRLTVKALDLETSHAGQQLELAGELATLSGWPTTIAQMIAAERDQTTLRLQIEKPADLSLLVDDRYQAFLAQAG